MPGQMNAESLQLENAAKLQMISELLTSNPLAAIDRAIDALLEVHRTTTRSWRVSS